ncbi:uncharacterized protein L203_104612 [Cryptococcus depauperatus CBS 7841]|uniref:Uncharacterized protein n=1 Tax=Cryptococcus depauperatus CBS 7841 TaxID=1295531 RepID=A0AAJ8JW13_9TREE
MRSLGRVGEERWRQKRERRGRKAEEGETHPIGCIQAYGGGVWLTQTLQPSRINIVIAMSSTFTSPPRRAPKPSMSSPKNLGRHIAMKEPSQYGLFTLCEMPEVEDPFVAGGNDSMTDADLTLIQTPEASLERRLSWSSNDSSNGVITPLLTQNEDPFLSWSNSDDYEMSRVNPQPVFAPLAKSLVRSRRAPPPLTLTTRFSLPPSASATPVLSALSATSTTADSEILTPLSAVVTGTRLMPALPIVSPGEWTSRVRASFPSPSTPTKTNRRRADVDIVSALDDIFTSYRDDLDVFACCSSDEGSDSESGPVRPTRSPRSPTFTFDPYTPERRTKRSSVPYAPRKPSRAHPHSQLPPSGNDASGLKGDHSFLHHLSKSRTPPSAKWPVKRVLAGSLNCKISGGMPEEWRFGQMI